MPVILFLQSFATPALTGFFRIVTMLGDEAGIRDISIAPNAKVNTDKRGIMWPYFSVSDKKKYVPAQNRSQNCKNMLDDVIVRFYFGL